MEGISFKVLESFDADLLQIIKKLEIENLGIDAALNEWQVPVIIRYGKFIVALNAEGDIIGVCQALRSWNNTDIAFIHSFYIVEKFRKMGAAASLLEYVISLLDSEKFKSIQLTVNPENSGALKLYSNSGFKIKELKKDEYGAGVDRYLMELKL